MKKSAIEAMISRHRAMDRESRFGIALMNIDAVPKRGPRSGRSPPAAEEISKEESLRVEDKVEVQNETEPAIHDVSPVDEVKE
jgi:hypothetical protein